jgi:hypothetical protein
MHEQIAASKALLQSRTLKTWHVEQLEGIETPPTVPAFGCDGGASE